MWKNGILAFKVFFKSCVSLQIKLVNCFYFAVELQHSKKITKKTGNIKLSLLRKYGADFVFVLDSSSKTKIYKWIKGKSLIQFLQRLFNKASSKNRYALISDKHNPKMIYNFGQSTSKISGMKHGKGSPATARALQLVIQSIIPKLRNGKRVPRIIIYVSPNKLLRTASLDKNIVVLLHFGFDIFHVSTAHRSSS